MGTYYDFKEAKFNVKGKNLKALHEAALNFTLEVHPDSYGDGSRDSVFIEDKVEGLFYHWDFEVTFSEDETKVKERIEDADFNWKKKKPFVANIVNILYASDDKTWDHTHEFLQSIAPYVEAGSWIEMVELNDSFRWYFNGTDLTIIEPQIVWNMPDNPDPLVTMSHVGSVINQTEEAMFNRMSYNPYGHLLDKEVHMPEPEEEDSWICVFQGTVTSLEQVAEGSEIIACVADQDGNFFDIEARRLDRTV